MDRKTEIETLTRARDTLILAERDLRALYAEGSPLVSHCVEGLQSRAAALRVECDRLLGAMNALDS